MSMSLKIAADQSVNVHPDPPPSQSPPEAVAVRVYDKVRDKAAVEELERLCEAAKQGKPSVVTDLLGDPAARIGHFSSHVMLVAEHGCNGELVGVIRGCIKSVTTGKYSEDHFPVYTKMACILGLRVSPAHRRLGIGTKLVLQLESWSKKHGADYAYMATDCSNQASLNLFTLKCNYIKFRSPTVLVQPVYAHKKPLHPGTLLVQVPPDLAELMYRRVFANSDFFPMDINTILNSKLNLGTFMALPKKFLSNWDPKSGTFPPSYAMLSIWDAKQVFKLKVQGVSPLKYACSLGSRALDAFLPCLKLPSIPNVFSNFGFYFLYGLHMEGQNASGLMKSLCAFAHNLARNDNGCRILVAEVSQNDPVREAIPHWRRFSWDDLWCMKKLTAGDEAEEEEEDNRSSFNVKPQVTFVDPRDL